MKYLSKGFIILSIFGFIFSIWTGLDGFKLLTMSIVFPAMMLATFGYVSLEENENVIQNEGRNNRRRRTFRKSSIKT